MADNTTIHPSAIDAAFSNIEEIIADVAAGKMVIMVDDREQHHTPPLRKRVEQQQLQCRVLQELQTCQSIALRLWFLFCSVGQ